jgi:peptide/nickel transport system ATP-binding protein
VLASGRAAEAGVDAKCRAEPLAILPAVPEAQAACYYADAVGEP